MLNILLAPYFYVEDVVKLVMERLKRKFSRVYVFGSRVKGTARPDSDIDVVVVDPSFRGKSVLVRVSDVLSEVWDIVEEYGVDIDVIALTPEEFSDRVSRRTNIIGYIFSRGEVVEA